MKKDTAIRLATGVAAIIIFMAAYAFLQDVITKKQGIQQAEGPVYANATVIELKQDLTQRDSATENVLRGSQEVTLKITSGVHKGELYEVTNYLSALYNIDCQERVRVVVRMDTRTDGSCEVTIYNYDRKPVLLLALAIFAALLLIIGGKKGLMSLVSLIYTLLNLLFLLIPALYYGAPVLLTTVLVIILSNVISFLFIDGMNKKTVAASLGTTAGVGVAGVFAFVLGRLSHISGFQTNEAKSLLLTGRDYGLSITNLFTAGILIAAMGAVMDVAMSIASSIHEVHRVNPQLSAKELFTAGMNIGRDAMGTMSNTLILAFVGSSMNLLIMIYSYRIPITQLWATDLMAREIIQGISGTIGIILTVPFVSFVGAVLFAEKDTTQSK